ncbi:MAG: glutamate racemase [Saprospiraceae bacterium]
MADQSIQQQAIGVFDSGIGGLTVANAIKTLLPYESIYYFGDTAHIPYGTQSASTIQQYCEDITTFLLQESCKIIVIACNTATAAALPQLRAKWPHISFVGMEPAVKPAVQASTSKKIGVLATQTTFKSVRYQNLLERFATGYTCFENPCIGLVELIEAGKWNHPETAQLLKQIIHPMLAEDVDTLVLGCTHYPFVKNLIAQIAGQGVQVIDPAPAVARQIERVLQSNQLQQLAPIMPTYKIWASGTFDSLQRALHFYDFIYDKIQLFKPILP